ncbi:MAG: ABC transporter ATP-binding protein [Erysipelotrichaceae bacterium]|nr:MAG: ABC transporter ATP-binding [Erysipelotrichaceae bacterium]TXT19596.1 MAG: ABC transporter ATP-binding protein [Erysipelotrichaceae bacterium]
MIALKNIKKSFDNKLVLENIDWEIPKGSIYGLVGPNGAGKSTLLRLMSGVLSPDAGQITLEGEIVYDNPSAKQKIMFVPDDPFFLTQSTLKEMKKFYQIFYASFNETMYQKLLGHFKLNENEKINDYSKGMKRQASVILALSCDPEVLLLDEAFDGLDPVMRLMFKRLITDELMNRQITVVISSHNLRELEDICDSIALLDQHTISIQDEVENIRSNYHKLQIGYTKEQGADIFKEIAPLHLEQRGHVYLMIAKGDISSIRALIESTQPVLLEEIPITMEEVFVYEMEAKGYGQLV